MKCTVLFEILKLQCEWSVVFLSRYVYQYYAYIKIIYIFILFAKLSIAGKEKEKELELFKRQVIGCLAKKKKKLSKLKI